MDEDEDWDDELPPIKVNSSGKDSMLFEMPSAEEIASQRARSDECERELRELRAEHLGEEGRAGAAGDSSSSEGEGALAAAVLALQVGAMSPAPPPPSPSSSPATQRLAALLLRHQPAAATEDTFLADYLQAIQEKPTHTQTISDNVLFGIVSMLSCEENEWSECESVCVCGWLCVCVWSGACSSRHEVRRALHMALQLLQQAQVMQLCEWMVQVCGEAQRLLELCDACRDSAGQGSTGQGSTLCTALLRAALHDILQHDALLQSQASPVSAGELLEAISPRWRHLDARAQYVVVQLVARALLCVGDAGTGRGDQPHADRDRLLALLAQPLHNADRHQPHYLKVLVGVSKMQLLFRAKK